MIPEEKDSLHAAVFRHTSADPTWLGYWLARHRQTEQLGPQQLAEKLQMPMPNLVLLSLCRTPRPDHFREDLEVVCRRTGAPESILAQILRQKQTLLDWSQGETPKTTGWLMAASDRFAAEGIPPAPKPEEDGNE